MKIINAFIAFVLVFAFFISCKNKTGQSTEKIKIIPENVFVIESFKDQKSLIREVDDIIIELKIGEKIIKNEIEFYSYNFKLTNSFDFNFFIGCRRDSLYTLTRFTSPTGEMKSEFIASFKDEKSNYKLPSFFLYPRELEVVNISSEDKERIIKIKSEYNFNRSKAQRYTIKNIFIGSSRAIFRLEVKDYNTGKTYIVNH